MDDQSWSIDATHSGIHFSVRHMVFAKVRGRFDSWRGTVRGDLSDPAKAGVDVTIDAGSIDTGVADRDTHLRSADFFDAERYPTIRFTSGRVERDGDQRYRLHGELTIRDVTRPVVLEAEHGGTGRDPWGNLRVAFTASTSIDRRDFGLTWNQVLEAGGVLVGERIEIELEVQAIRASGVKAA